MKKKLSNLSILYIENDFSLQKKVTSHLKKIFTNVTQVENGTEGLMHYKTNNPDIVLTDLNFDDVSPFEMVVEMQNFNPEASIMVLSKRNDDFDLLETLDLGLVALLEKPLNFNSLNKALQKVVLQKPNKNNDIPIHQEPKKTIETTDKIKDILPKQNVLKTIEKIEIKKPILKHTKTEEKENQKATKTTTKKTIVETLKKEKPTMVKKQIEISKPHTTEKKEAKEIPKNKTIEKEPIIIPEIDYTLCDPLITATLKNNSNIVCTNSYKGLIISNNSKIVKFEYGLIMIQVPKTQMFSIVHEKKVTIQIGDKYILAKLFRINKEESQIILKEPVLLDFKPRDKTNKRLNVDKSFKATIGFNNMHKELKAIEVSEHYVILESNTILDIKSNLNIELTMGFEIDAPSSMIIDKKFIKVFAKGIVERVDLLQDKQRIVINHKIQTTGLNVYKQYLQQREISIITEFKSKMKNKL